MTVAELIEELKKLPPDLPVRYSGYDQIEDIYEVAVEPVGWERDPNEKHVILS